ncbi:hypothetical protein IV203_017939 [Nitzschia inconspicua]|uniref:Uncharacterized protein n=1 Tax=Nitzschia inconspicua TaxID=303405 RepID=A0A9K3M0W6_9STRA|nr:hypothetical protein IV203_017939 [Nitzschia inconspicua]
MRVNAYIIAKSRCESLEHKQFVEQYIIALNNRAAIADHYAATRSAVMAITSPPCATNRRRRMGTKRPSLPEDRFKGKRSDHQVLVNKTQKACIYCSYERAVAKLNSVEPLRKVANVTRVCLLCRQHICCRHYWDVFNGWS